MLIIPRLPYHPLPNEAARGKVPPPKRERDTEKESNNSHVSFTARISGTHEHQPNELKQPPPRSIHRNSQGGNFFLNNSLSKLLATMYPLMMIDNASCDYAARLSMVPCALSLLQLLCVYSAQFNLIEHWTLNIVTN